jgi:hypothetical protein
MLPESAPSSKESKGAVVVAGIEDLVRDPDCKTLSEAARIMTPISNRTTTPKISKPAMPTSTESADT